MRKLTDLDKLECAKYTLDILEDAFNKTPALTDEFTMNMGDILDVAQDEVNTRRSQYLFVDEPIAPKGEEDE